MRKLYARWVVPNRYWKGDDWAGQWVQVGPDFVHHAEVLQFVVTPEGNTKAVLLEDGKLHTMDIDELTVIEGEAK